MTQTSKLVETATRDRGQWFPLEGRVDRQAVAEAIAERLAQFVEVDGHLYFRVLPMDMGAPQKIPDEALPELLERYIRGATLADLAAEYNASFEALRLRFPRDARERKTAYRERIRAGQQFVAACRRAIDENRKCQVCGAWILRGAFATCSPEHAAAWRIIRDVENPDARRRAQAKVHLRSPDLYSESQLEWARRMLSDDPPQKNRGWLVPGSRRAEIIRKYRPETYQELTGAGG